MADDFASLVCPLPECTQDLYLNWRVERPLFLGDLATPAPVDPGEAWTGDWKVECVHGHVVLVPGPSGCQQDEVCAGDCDCDIDHDEQHRTFRASDIVRLSALLAQLGGGDSHIIEFTDNGWTLSHPLACRPRLFECEVNRASGAALHGQPIKLGRFRCDVKDGQLVVGEAVADA